MSFLVSKAPGKEKKNDFPKDIEGKLVKKQLKSHNNVHPRISRFSLSYADDEVFITYQHNDDFNGLRNFNMTNLSQTVRKRTLWHLCPTTTQISLRIRAA